MNDPSHYSKNIEKLLGLKELAEKKRLTAMSAGMSQQIIEQLTQRINEIGFELYDNNELRKEAVAEARRQTPGNYNDSDDGLII